MSAARATQETATAERSAEDSPAGGVAAAAVDQAALSGVAGTVLALHGRGGRAASDGVLALQRTLGNRAVANIVARQRRPRAAASRPLLRAPDKPKPQPLDKVGDYTYLHDPVARKTVISFRGQEWVTLTWKRGEPIGVQFQQRWSVSQPYADQEVDLRISSDGWAQVHVSQEVEDQILATMPMNVVAIAYDFRLDGELTGVSDDGTTKAPAWRRVEERRPTDTVVGPPSETHAPPKPKVTERLAITQSYEFPDTYRSFGDEKSLRSYLKAHPKLKAAIIQMPDGHFIVRELSEADVRRLAEAARERRARPDSLEDVRRYRGQLTRGVFQSLWLDGTEYGSLNELADSYYDDPGMAGFGSAAAYRECEVFEIGASSYGRRALTHPEALARLEQIDKLSRDEVLALESAPGRKFESLWFAGASGRVHTVDAAYLRGRDDFKAKLKAIDAAADDDARKWQLEHGTAAMFEYLDVELDRERDNPDVVAALRGHKEFTEGLQLLFYSDVRRWARRRAIEILLRSAAQIRGIVGDDRKLRTYLQGFPQLSAEAQEQSLTFLGVPPGEVSAWTYILRQPQNAMQVALGFPIQFDIYTIGLERLQTYARKNMDGVEDFARQLEQETVDPLKIAGPFGDSLRTAAYREFGFKTLDPAKYPHKDRVSQSFPGPLSGDRASFSNLGEQLFANQARLFGSLETIDKVLLVTGVIVVTVALMIAFNVAGLAIAEAVFGLAEGTLGWFVVGGAIGGTFAGAAEVGLQAALGGNVTPEGALETIGEGAAMGAFFGGVGRIMKGVGAGWRIAGMGATFLATSASVQRLKTGKWPWEGTTEQLAFWFYENALSFALIEAGGVVARPLTEKVGIWSRMQRLGVMPEARAAFLADAARLNRDLSAFVVRPQRAEPEASALEQRYTDLLGRQRKLVEDAATVIRGQERSAALEQELQAELNVIDGQLRSMRAVRFLADLKVKPVGETQTAFEYEARPDAQARIQQFYSGADVKLEEGGIITVKLAGEKNPLVFIPAGSAAPPPVASPGTPAAKDGKVNINTASAKELADDVPGIGKKLAEKIVAERAARGGFKSVDELQSILPPAAFAKAAPVLTTVSPPTPSLQERLVGLDERRQAIIERSNRTGVGDPTIERIRRMNIGSRRTERSLAEAETLIAAAEKVGGAKIDAAAERAYSSRRAAKGIGKEGMDAVRADALSDVSNTEIGEALLPLKGLRELTPGAIRGIVYARRANVDLSGFVETARGGSVAERNFVLETYARLKDARVAGADKVLFDTGTSWAGGLWAMEYARYGAGIENIKQLEMKVEVDGVVRRVDVALKDGTNVELKNWGEWDRYKESLLFEFEKDVQQGRFDPALFKKQRYLFREPAPAPLSQIRAEMRARLSSVLHDEVAGARMTNDRAQEVLAAFDAESALVGTSPVRYSGAPAVPPPTPGTPAPLPRTDDDDSKKKPTPQLPVPVGVP